MTLWAIRNYDKDHGPTGYHLGPHGPLVFDRKSNAEAEAQRLNAAPHAPGRTYIAERIQD